MRFRAAVLLGLLPEGVVVVVLLVLAGGCNLEARGGVSALRVLLEGDDVFVAVVLEAAAAAAVRGGVLLVVGALVSLAAGVLVVVALLLVVALIPLPVFSSLRKRNCSNRDKLRLVHSWADTTMPHLVGHVKWVVPSAVVPL